MAEYNGSIELIAGLKPKNNGNFPLLNAPDVLMPDGRRLSDIDFENLGGGGALAVTFTDITQTEDGRTTATASHTASEIKAAHDSGQYVYASIDIMGEGIPYYLPLVVSFASDDFSMAAFGMHMGEAFVQVAVADGNSAEIVFLMEGSGSGGDTFPVPFGLSTETIDATCEVSYSEIATAVEEGKFVYGMLDWVGMPVVLPFKGLISLEGTFALFETALDFMGLQMSVLIHENGEIETRASQISGGGGGAAPSVPPTGVDMSRFESDGIIEETYADGSVKTTTIEYDSTGNPVKITDGDGNVTEFTW
jgi:uncharacterized protein RhaS with RHS repeats